MRAAFGVAIFVSLFLVPVARADPAFLAGEAGFSVSITREGGTAVENRAGAHPYGMTTTLGLEGGDLRTLEVEMPAGLVENPSSLLTCNRAQFGTPRASPFEASFSGESCPNRSQVGIVTVRSDGGTTRTFGVFNLVPGAGAPSHLGFSPFGVSVVLTPRIRQAGGEYGITLVGEIPASLGLRAMTLTIWGTPWETNHNTQRGNCLNEAEPGFGWAKCPISPPQPEHAAFAYLTLPASCREPMDFTARVNSWQGGGALTAALVKPPLEHCDELHFEPVTTAASTVFRASSASGFDFTLTPKEEALVDPERRVPSQVRRAVVALPDGMTINPSLAAGLGACTPQQYEAETATSGFGAACPANSKIGTFTVESPLFEDPIGGTIFLAQPDDLATSAPGAENPFDALLAVYLIAKEAPRGILVKVAGQIQPDPASGQLVAKFDRLPQLPYSNLRIHFREGQRAPLITPAACGTYATEVDLTPWNDPRARSRSSFPLTISKGLGASEACPQGAAPFNPGAVGGMLNANAGSYSSFYLHLTRTDSEQEFTSYSATLPPGLLGKIANIPYCPEAAIDSAKLRTGVEEEMRPSCPSASQIGHTFSGYGVGPVLAYAPGRLYLAGPYRGSTFSVVAINSATVGPFDLGVIVIRSAIRVDRHNARVTIDSAVSDPIPHILAGVPLHLRDIRVYIDRERTMINPTSCDPLALSSTMTSAGASLADRADDGSATVVNRFQVSNCSALGFRPGFQLRLRGGSGRGAFPSLRALYRPRRGDANTASAAVTLPPSLFLAQEHIGAVCTRVQSAREACPAASVYGHATAVTPLLGDPLEGPVYLRASNNKLPDLVTDLHGDGIGIEVAGRIDSSHGGLRATFEGLPDAPVSAFQMVLKGGKHGLLVSAARACARSPLARARFLGQANRGVIMRPRVEARCGLAPGSAARGRGR
jgi:hypothetical protein